MPGAPDSLPKGMYLSVDEPTRSLRTLPVDGDELLLVGGNGHVTDGPVPGRRAGRFG